MVFTSGVGWSAVTGRRPAGTARRRATGRAQTRMFIQQSALHLAEGNSRRVLLLLRERRGHVLPEPAEMLADDPADLFVARCPVPGVRGLAAGRGRHARQRRHPECLFLISKQPGPGSQIVKEQVEHPVEGVRPGNPPVGLLHVQNHVNDLAEHLAEGGQPDRRARAGSPDRRAGAGSRRHRCEPAAPAPARPGYWITPSHPRDLPALTSGSSHPASPDETAQ